jgi:hypothetical protein
MDGGASYEHRTFFLATWPGWIPTTVQALNAQGDVLAAVHVPEAAVLTSNCNIQRQELYRIAVQAYVAGDSWAVNHPDSRDPIRLAPPRGEPYPDLGGSPSPPPGATVPRMDMAIESDVLTHVNRALEDLAAMGRVEIAEYRQVAGHILGEGEGCYSRRVADAARAFLAASKRPQR